MKRLFIGLLTALTLLGTTPIFALEQNSNTYIAETFEDGSYIQVTIEEELTPTTRASGGKTGHKISEYKDSNNKLLWSVKVTGFFTYTGSSATCNSSSVSTQCPALSWKLSDAHAFKSYADAYASVTAKRHNGFGTVLQTINETVRLSCRPDGTLY